MLDSPRQAAEATDRRAIGLTRGMAALTSALRLTDIEPAAAAWAKLAITDLVACGLAGADEPVGAMLQAALPPSAGDAFVFGARERRGLLDAAQINGAAAHALDFDDCSIVLDGHPSVPVVPALLALGDTIDASGAELLTAYVAGIEAMLRLGRLSNPAHIDRGWHPTATLGIIGCAVACARLLRLDPERTARAISIAASSASGLRANSGTMTKPLHAAMANRNGLQAAWLAAHGMTANPAALEHAMGYLSAYNGAPARDADAAFDDWTTRWLVLEPGIAIKQYPCCAFIHCAIDAAASLREERRFRPQDIEAVRVHLHRRRLRNIDRPRPADGLDARFSTQYLTARGLVHGTVTLGDFEPETMGDPRVQALMGRVEIVAHDLDDLSFGRVEITLRDGTRHEAGASVSMGRGPADPMDEARFRAKFDDCAGRSLPAAARDEVFAALQSLERRDSIRALTELMRRAVVA